MARRACALTVRVQAALVSACSYDGARRGVASVCAWRRGAEGLFGYDYKLLFRRENARSEKIPPNALRHGRLSTSRLQLAGRVCTENQESEIAATISILCIAARPSRGFLVSEDKQALKGTEAEANWGE